MFGVVDKEREIALAMEELREEARAEGLEAGRKAGHEERDIQSIQVLMKKMGLTAIQAMELLDIPEEQRERYLSIL